MNLLVVVLENAENIEDLLSVLVELDVGGLQVAESSTVMDILARETPIFAGLRDLITRPQAESKIVFGLTDNDQILDRLGALMKRIGLDLDESGTGYAFLMPVGKWIGQLGMDAD